MAKQNRVTPFGEIVATPERGTVMGNRGRLHDDRERIRRPWQVKRWILCRLEFNGRRRVVMAPDRYTELFFLDEATGLAAGHRPCFECRRDSFHSFADAWAIGNLLGHSEDRPTAGSIDDRLHAERILLDRSKRTFRANLDELPDGVFVSLAREKTGTGTSKTRSQSPFPPYLLRDGHLHAWSPGGYREKIRCRAGTRVTVLTPASTVAAIRAGYEPEIHPSARG